MCRLIFIFSLCFIICIAVNSFSLDKERELIIEGAKKEGKLVWYGSLADYTAKRLLYEFEEKYPFIKTEYREEASSFTGKKKYISQVESNNVEVDLIHFTDIVMYQEFKKKNLLLYYASPEYAYYPKEYKDEGYWVTLRLISICIAYNEQVISKNEAPKHWKDLLDPKWKGKISLGDPTKKGTRYAQYYTLSQQYGKEFWEKLSLQDCRIEGSGDPARADWHLSDWLLDKSRPIAATYLDYLVYKYGIKQGKPIRGVWPPEGVPVIQSPIAITANAPHPNCAKLFMDYILSLEAQTLLQVLDGSYSVRDGVPTLPGKIPFSQLKPFPINWDDYFAKQKEYQNEFKEIFKKDYPK